MSEGLSEGRTDGRADREEYGNKYRSAAVKMPSLIVRASERAHMTPERTRRPFVFVLNGSRGPQPLRWAPKLLHRIRRMLYYYSPAFIKVAMFS